VHVQQNLRSLIQQEFVESAHDISEGGLFVALLESAIVRGLGFEVETDGNFRKDAYLFGESQSRIVVTVRPENEDAVVNHLNMHNVSFTRLGEVKGDQAIIDDDAYGSIADLKAVYDNSLAQKLDQ